MIDKVLHVFGQKTKTVQSTQRAKFRMKEEEWETCADLACIVYQIIKEAKQISTTSPDTLDEVRTAWLNGHPL